MLSREAEIISLYLDGISIEEIAKNLLCSYDEVFNSIINYRKNRVVKFINDLEYDEQHLAAVGEYVKESIEKIQVRVNSDERRRIINMIKLMEDGMNMAAIGNIFSVSRERVRQILKTYSPELLIARASNSYKVCSICGEKKRGVWNRGGHKYICNTCHDKIIKANKIRWSREYDKCIDCGTTKEPHHIKGRCSKCYSAYSYHYDLKRKKSIKKSSEKWRQKNIEKVRALNKKTSEKLMKMAMGGNREKALMRDQYKCTVCGLSAEMSLNRYARALYVSHIGSKEDDRVENLKTLCAVCHDNIFRRGRRLLKVT